MIYNVYIFIIFQPFLPFYLFLISVFVLCIINSIVFGIVIFDITEPYFCQINVYHNFIYIHKSKLMHCFHLEHVLRPHA